MKKYFIVVYGANGFTNYNGFNSENTLEEQIKSLLYVDKSEQASLIWAPNNMTTKRTKNNGAFIVITTEDITENQLGKLYLDKIYEHNVMRTQTQNFEIFVKQISDDISIPL